MASNYYTEFPEKKVTAGKPPANARAGGETRMPQKQGYAKSNLPGPASNAFAVAKRGFKEVNGYANYEGLSNGGGKWIQKAIKHPGALTKKANKAGESPMGFAREHMHDSGKTGQQARLAITLRKMHK